MAEFACRGCYAILEWESTKPDDCPRCLGIANWKRLSPWEPSRPYHLTYEDWVFLKVQGITSINVTEDDCA